MGTEPSSSSRFPRDLETVLGLPLRYPHGLFQGWQCLLKILLGIVSQGLALDLLNCNLLTMGCDGLGRKRG